jgi:alkylation response protein AidB-like acyl-CoA dehydrogenase
VGLESYNYRLTVPVASSDATNLKNTTARVEGNQVVLSGHKWVRRAPPNHPMIQADVV